MCLPVLLIPWPASFSAGSFSATSSDLFAANFLACYKEMEAESSLFVPSCLLVLPHIQ